MMLIIAVLSCSNKTVLFLMLRNSGILYQMIVQSIQFVVSYENWLRYYICMFTSLMEKLKMFYLEEQQ